eukprot:g37049.t1
MESENQEGAQGKKEKDDAPKRGSDKASKPKGPSEEDIDDDTLWEEGECRIDRNVYAVRERMRENVEIATSYAQGKQGTRQAKI